MAMPSIGPPSAQQPILVPASKRTERELPKKAAPVTKARFNVSPVQDLRTNVDHTSFGHSHANRAETAVHTRGVAVAVPPGSMLPPRRPSLAGVVGPPTLLSTQPATTYWGGVAQAPLTPGPATPPTPKNPEGQWRPNLWANYSHSGSINASTTCRAPSASQRKRCFGRYGPAAGTANGIGTN
eukprot:4359397-Heterocapsa_arctica.AAC.1